MLNAQELSCACDALLKGIWKSSPGKTTIYLVTGTISGVLLAVRCERMKQCRCMGRSWLISLLKGSGTVEGIEHGNRTDADYKDKL